MQNQEKEKTLLQMLLECFSASKTDIKYVFEKECGGKLTYELPFDNIVDWWKLLYSKNIVALSIAPRSHDKQLSKDALSAFVRCVINDKNKSIVEKNLSPHLSGKRCHDLIAEEVLHLNHTIELGVRAEHSPVYDDGYSVRISCEKMKKAEEVQVYIDDAIELLKQLFFGEPVNALSQSEPWFVDSFKEFAGSSYQGLKREQVLTVLASALVLCLNVKKETQITKNIEKFLKSALASDSTEKSVETGALCAEKTNTEICKPVNAVSSAGSNDKKANVTYSEIRSTRIITALENSFNLLVVATDLAEFNRATSRIKGAMKSYIDEVALLYMRSRDDIDTDGSNWKLKQAYHETWLRKGVNYCRDQINEHASEIDEIKQEFLNYIDDVHIRLEMLQAQLFLEQQALEMSGKLIGKEERSSRIDRIKDEYDYWRDEVAKDYEASISEKIAQYSHGYTVDKATI